MPDVYFGGGSSNSWFDYNNQILYADISVPARRTAANGQGPQLITHVAASVAGYTTTITLRLYAGGKKTGTLTRSADSTPGSTGLIGLTSDLYLANGSTVSFGASDNSDGVYFNRSGSGTTRISRGNSWGGTIGGGYRYLESPTAPATLTATPSTTVTGQVNLSWGAVSDSGGSAVTSYNVYTKVGSTYTLRGTTSAAQTTSRTFSVTGLTQNTSFTFVVRARNLVTDTASTQSVDSPTATATAPFIPPPVSAPGVPTSVDATTSTATLGAVGLTWVAPASNGGTSLTDYRIYVNGAYYGNKGGTGTSYTVTGLNQRELYSFYVTAVNGGGFESPPSASDTAKAAGVPSAPTNLVALADGFTSARINLTWSAPSDPSGTIAGYRIYNASSDSLLIDTASTATTYSFSSLTLGTTYSYYVRAYNAFGTSPATSYSDPSNTDDAVAVSVTGAPTVTASATVPGRLVIVFNETSGATGYTITNVTTGATVSLPGTVQVVDGKISYSFDGLTAGTFYTFTKQPTGGQLSEASTPTTPVSTVTLSSSNTDAITNDTNSALNGSYTIASRDSFTLTYANAADDLAETNIGYSTLSTATNTTNQTINGTKAVTGVTSNTLAFSTTIANLNQTAVSVAALLNLTNTRLNGTFTVASVSSSVLGGDNNILTYNNSTAEITAISPAVSTGGVVENITQASFNTVPGSPVAISAVTDTTISYVRTGESVVEEVPAVGTVINNTNKNVFNAPVGNSQIATVPSYNEITYSVGASLATSITNRSVANPLDSVTQVTKSGTMEVVYRPGSLG